MTSAPQDREDPRGAAMVEAAIVLPIVILLILGIFEFGRAYNAKITLTHATREAVREYSISADPDAAEAILFGAASPLDTDLIQVATTDCTRGEPTSVTATYPFTFTYLFGSMTIDMTSTAVMRCGG